MGEIEGDWVGSTVFSLIPLYFLLVLTAPEFRTVVVNWN